MTEQHTHYHHYPESQTPDRVKMAVKMIGHFQQVTDPSPVTRAGGINGIEVVERDGRALGSDEKSVHRAALETVRNFINGEICQPEAEDERPQWMSALPDYPGWFVFLDGRDLTCHLAQARITEVGLEMRIRGREVAEGETPIGAWIDIAPPPVGFSLFGMQVFGEQEEDEDAA